MEGRFEIAVNGASRIVDADGETALLYVLRNTLGLKGSRFGCGHEQCGACMVLVDGQPSYACTLPVSAVSGKRVTTIEGLGTADAPHPLQQAFLSEQAGQCGYCLSGILISAAALLATNPNPSRADVAVALEPHLCRCGVHNRIMRAVLRAAAALRGDVVPA